MQPSALNAQPGALNVQPGTLNVQPGTSRFWLPECWGDANLWFPTRYNRNQAHKSSSQGLWLRCGGV